MGFLWVTITQKINRVVIIQHGLILFPSVSGEGEGESPLEDAVSSHPIARQVSDKGVCLLPSKSTLRKVCYARGIVD